MPTVNERSAVWRKERVSFNAAYGNERVSAYVFLPRKFRPPFQAVVHFPGSGVIFTPTSEQDVDRRTDDFGFIVESGRAVIFPVYKGTYERRDGLRTVCPEPTNFYRDHVVQWSKDLGRTLDYLETRPDIQTNKVAYYGWSWGASLGAILPALEPRLRASILTCGGFYLQQAHPEVDQINFLPRITLPTLMVNGRYDFFYPIESCQDPMFRLLGTQPQDKRHVILDSGHGLPRGPLVREALAWLDRYLGPVKQ